MPKRDVIFHQHGFYHLYNRASGYRNLFREDSNYLYVIRKLEKYCIQLKFTIIAYCLLPNHYHLLIRQDGDHPAGE